MTGSGGDVTRLLAQLREGRDAADQLIPLLYDQLRRMAAAYIQRERPGHTLPATALVHEAYPRLVSDRPAQNHALVLAITAHIVRRVLMDYARQQRADKGGGAGERKLELDVELLLGGDTFEHAIAIDEVLGRRAPIDPQMRPVELRVFAGLDVDEATEAMAVSAITMRREPRSAKAWQRWELATARSE